MPENKQEDEPEDKVCTHIVYMCCHYLLLWQTADDKSEGAGQGEETVGVRRRKEEKKVEDEPEVVEDSEFTVRKSPRCMQYLYLYNYYV